MTTDYVTKRSIVEDSICQELIEKIHLTLELMLS